ncbi:hypothetical protein BLNAU_14007 [Blattamonas nauphoetae]|uniref:Uncharacterized protein n=1 Tax=Blattamonas nauphoetae TaxID=2049346 RepID=A0ABQ9XGD0_9EUKA|nr:hypothetical protein BLNAU_14007 [Blattamonas nauphoetae]
MTRDIIDDLETLFSNQISLQNKTFQHSLDAEYTSSPTVSPHQGIESLEISQSQSIQLPPLAYYLASFLSALSERCHSNTADVEYIRRAEFVTQEFINTTLKNRNIIPLSGKSAFFRLRDLQAHNITEIASVAPGNNALLFTFLVLFFFALPSSKAMIPDLPSSLTMYQILDESLHPIPLPSPQDKKGQPLSTPQPHPVLPLVSSIPSTTPPTPLSPQRFPTAGYSSWEFYFSHFFVQLRTLFECFVSSMATVGQFDLYYSKAITVGVFSGMLSFTSTPSPFAVTSSFGDLLTNRSPLVLDEWLIGQMKENVREEFRSAAAQTNSLLLPTHFGPTSSSKPARTEQKMSGQDLFNKLIKKMNDSTNVHGQLILSSLIRHYHHTSTVLKEPLTKPETQPTPQPEKTEASNDIPLFSFGSRDKQQQIPFTTPNWNVAGKDNLQEAIPARQTGIARSGLFEPVTKTTKSTDFFRSSQPVHPHPSDTIVSSRGSISIPHGLPNATNSLLTSQTGQNSSFLFGNGSLPSSSYRAFSSSLFCGFTIPDSLLLQILTLIPSYQPLGDPINVQTVSLLMHVVLKKEALTHSCLDEVRKRLAMTYNMTDLVPNVVEGVSLTALPPFLNYIHRFAVFLNTSFLKTRRVVAKFILPERIYEWIRTYPRQSTSTFVENVDWALHKLSILGGIGIRVPDWRAPAEEYEIASLVYVNQIVFAPFIFGLHFLSRLTIHVSPFHISFDNPETDQKTPQQPGGRDEVSTPPPQTRIEHTEDDRSTIRPLKWLKKWNPTLRIMAQKGMVLTTVVCVGVYVLVQAITG